tara:strand:- start:238 stop:747 length:510 start_codon:yes stop_codon:yes gene_type:complete
MKTIRIEKITLNMGVGQAGDGLDKANNLLQEITKAKPVLTKTMKRNPTWGLRPNLTIGTKVTLRGEKARELFVRLLKSKGDKIDPKNFDDKGNFAFGIHEYIDIPGAEYDPKIGIRGLEVAVTLERPGYRIKRRKLSKKRIPTRHRITKEEAQEFVKTEFNVVLEEEEK